MSNNDNYDDQDNFDDVNNDIAIIGMAGRFPMADNVDEFWTNLVSSQDCITRFPLDELAKMGVAPAALADPNFVPAAGFIPDQDKFDAHFFEMNPREAAQLDPQHRFALEVAYQTLEHAGYTPESVNGSIGVFAGVNMSTYFIFNLLKGDEATSASDALDTQISVDKDMFASRISYKLNLNGPSIALGTACSTSLVCIHLACQSLLNGESKLALAGGSHIATPNCTGHIFHEGGYSSPDGYCRAFDAKGKGTVGGNGTCFVLLKRLDDALADNDTIYAVIKGSAVNNDGSEKIGYTAPSIAGQTNIIAEAQAVAGVEPDSIRFIEAHGTATELGDPIEFTALTRAFRLGTDKKNFCGIGSVKTNIGHLGLAAGAASIIKTALALKNKVIPESLNFEKPNPKLDIDNSPFYVVDKLERIAPGEFPARAGVSSLGIGGTNAHIVLEEPPITESGKSRDWQLLLLSAKTPGALDRMTENLGGHFVKTSDEKLADAAFTLQVGRCPYAFRRAFVVKNGAMQAVAGAIAPAKGFTAKAADKPKKVVFMFPGGGTQYVDMARGLYESEPLFREQLDACAALFQRKMGLDLISLVYPKPEQAEANAELLQRPKNFFAALFAVEYSLAKLWMAWGIKPDAVIGHSLGEYTAACLAGVFSLEQAVDLICMRGALFDKLEKGAMLAVTLPAAEVEKLLIDGMSIATVNDPGRCTVAGRIEPMQQFEAVLQQRQIEYRKLFIDTAGHSPLVDAILPEFGRFLASMKFSTPSLPMISNLSGGWADPAQVATADYWKNHLRQTVRFADGVAALLKDDNTVFIEMGPGNALCSFVRSQTEPGSATVLLNAIRHIKDEKNDQCHLLETLGKAWIAGLTIDWQAFYAKEKRKRIALPAYPFERKRYWVENRKAAGAPVGAKLPVAEWFWQPSWRLDEQRAALPDAQGRYLVFLDRERLGAGVIARLRQQGAHVVSVGQTSTFEEIDEENFQIDAANPQDYRRLLARLSSLGKLPQTVCHCWSLSAKDGREDSRHDCQLSLVYFAQAIDAEGITDPLRILAVTSRAESVLTADGVNPAQALIAGPARVIPYEYPQIRINTFDVDADSIDEDDFSAAALNELAQLSSGDGGNAIALRNGLRFVKDVTPLATPANAAVHAGIKEGDVYVVTGGLGGVGMAHAQALAEYRTRLALVQRGGLPPEDQWEALADPVQKEQIRGIKSLREQGAQVIIVQADITDASQAEQALAQVRSAYGCIDGLVHCAGYGEFVPVRETSRVIIDNVLAPKVTGTANLLAALVQDRPHLVLLCSSMSVQTTGFGLVGYVSACAYLDAVAQAHRNDPHTRYLSINWDVWNTPLQAVKAQQDAALSARLKDARLDAAILPREGVDVIYRALASGCAQAVISTMDFRQLQRKNREASDLLRADDVPDDTATTDAAALALYERPSLSTEYVAPSTPEEKLLASIWQETLGIAKVGVNDNFFELGGESLLGVKIVVKAKKMGLAIEPKQMFATPTIAQIVSNLGKPAAAPIATHDASKTEFGLSPLQSDIYARYRDTGRRPANITQALNVMEGPLDKGLLAAVWQALIARHKALRTRFVLEGENPVQVTAPQAEFALVELDYSDLDQAAQMRALDDLMARDRLTRYDLSQAPAMRVVWIDLDKNARRFAILLSQHQIILDGWTSSLLSRDLLACLMSLAAGKDLPATVTDADFGRYLDWLALQDTPECHAWWRQTFAGYAPNDPLIDLMAATPLASNAEDVYATEEFDIDADLLAQIQQCAKATRTTGNAIFQGAWSLALAQIGGATDIVYGVTVSGRAAEFEGIEEVVGQCTNSLPVRVTMDGKQSVARLLQAIHHINAEVQAHNALSASTIAKLVGCAPGEKLYSSNFVFENVPRAASGESVLPIKTVATKWADGWHFPLRVFVVPDEDKTWIRFAYDRSLFHSTDIAALAESYRRHLAAIAAQPDAQLSNLLPGVFA